MDIIALVNEYGKDNLIITIPFEYDVWTGVETGYVKKIEIVEVTIDESKWKLSENYKLTLHSIDPDICDHEYYICDFNSLCDRCEGFSVTVKPDILAIKCYGVLIIPDDTDITDFNVTNVLHGTDYIELLPKHIKAICEGKQVATHNDEYGTIIKQSPDTHDSLKWEDQSNNFQLRHLTKIGTTTLTLYGKVNSYFSVRAQLEDQVVFMRQEIGPISEMTIKEAKKKAIALFKQKWLNMMF